LIFVETLLETLTGTIIKNEHINFIRS